MDRGNSQTAIAELNGLRITLDAATGSIVKMEYPGVGTMLDTARDAASLVDVALPVERYEPLRLASRFSSPPRIETTSDTVIVRYDALGPSRRIEGLEGRVAAVVTLKAAPDGRSILMTCALDNQTTAPIRQTLFPDFMGLIPFAGDEQTRLRMGLQNAAPFRELRVPEADRFYAQDNSYAEFTSQGSQGRRMGMRWLDFGGLGGGMSLFPERWGWDRHNKIMAHLTQATGKLRLAAMHEEAIAPGAHWESGVFRLTPHTNGWAKGIEPYRQWVSAHLEREFPTPRHVREGLGYRSVWMCEQYAEKPEDAVWSFSDLPELARECREHGLGEMVLWFWNPIYHLPLPPISDFLGGEEGLIRAVEECRKLGVTVSPFISILQQDSVSGPRYGLTVTDAAPGWTFHTELIPRIRPYYASGKRTLGVNTGNPVWHADALADFRKLIEKGIVSFSWDQFWTAPTEPNIQSLTREVRRAARQKDPGSSFSGEELWNWEAAAAYLDFTWNWGHWGTRGNAQPVVSVFPAPRFNLNIDRSPVEVKLGFADGLFLNVQPCKPDGINGSARIGDYPELSRALTQCAALRARFLDFFTQGTFIGECLLTEPCAGSHVSAYALGDRVLAVVVNRGETAAPEISCDVAPWVTSAAPAYEVRVLGEDGAVRATRTMAGGRARVPLEPIAKGEMAVLEFVPKR